MRKILSLALLGASLVLPAIAADTSGTIVQRRTLTPEGVTPRVGYIEVTAAAGAETVQAMTFDAVKPNNGMAIIGFDATSSASDGSEKLLRVTYASNTGVFTVQSNTVPGMTLSMGKISASDVVKVNLKYGY